LEYEMHGHRVLVSTVDLGRDWQSIREELLDIVDGVLAKVSDPAA